MPEEFNIFKDILGGDPTDPLIINRFIDHLIVIAIDLIGVVCIIYMIIGGIQLITSAGNQETAQKGKNALTYAIVGFIIVMLARLIITEFELFLKS